MHRLQQPATAFWEAEKESQKEEGKVDEKTFKAAKKPQDRDQEQTTTGPHTHNGKRKWHSEGEESKPPYLS